MITYDDKDKIIQACNVMLIQYRRNMCGCEFSHTSSTGTKVEVLSFTYSGLNFTWLLNIDLEKIHYCLQKINFVKLLSVLYNMPRKLLSNKKYHYYGKLTTRFISGFLFK